jgi:hypothetical protein
MTVYVNPRLLRPDVIGTRNDEMAAVIFNSTSFHPESSSGQALRKTLKEGTKGIL